MITISRILICGGLTCCLCLFGYADEIGNETFSDTTESTKEKSSSSATRNVKLQESIVTAASGSEKNVIDAPASVNIITKEELEQKPYRDLGEAIKEVPGVSLDETSNKLGASAISIRGMPSGYTLFLVDDLRQNPSGDVATANLGAGVYNTFIPPMGAIERIEVIKGPMSTLYGSDAIGGVVNIITKPITDKWHTSFQSQIIVPQSSTFGNTYQNSLWTQGGLTKHLGLTFRVRQIHRNPSDRPKNDLGQDVSTFFGTKFSLLNVGTRLTWLPDSKNMLYADVDYTTSNYDNRKEEIGTLGVNANGRGGYEKNVGVDKILGAIGHKGSYDFGTWKNTLQFMRTNNTGRLVAGNTSSPNLGKNRDIASNDVIADTRLLLPLGESNILNVGAEYRFENYYDLAATPASHNRHTFALFAEDEYNIFEPLTFTLGARYNHNDKFGSNISPRAYLVYEILDGFALKGGVATGYKAPYANQLIDAVYGYGSQGTLAFLGNPNLKPETSVSYEIGTIFDGRYIDFSLMFFRSNFKDKIENTRVNKNANGAFYEITCQNYGGGGTNTQCNLAINADSAFSQGVESSFGIKPIYGVGFDVAYTFVDSEITSGSNKGRPLSSVAKHNIVSKLSYTHNKFHIYVQGQHKAGLLNTNALGNTPDAIAIRNILGGTYYKPYTIVNLGLGYKITESIRLNGGVYNLFDTNFIDFRNYSASGNVNMHGAYIQEGRRYWANITLDF